MPTKNKTAKLHRFRAFVCWTEYKTIHVMAEHYGDAFTKAEKALSKKLDAEDATLIRLTKTRKRR